MEIKRVLIFIPAKNESATITTVITSSTAVLQKMHLAADTLVIDDGSSDNTSTLAHQAGARVITHPESIGLGSIFKEAVEFAVLHEYDYLVTIDGDKQFDEQEIPSLLQPILDDEADFCSGNRFMSGNDIEHMSKIKKVGNTIVARLVNYILRSKYTDVSCGFRTYNRKALLHLNLQGGFTYTQEVFLNLGFKKLRIREIPITVTYYPTRTSRIANKIFTYGYHVLKIMLSSLIYYKPMRFFGTVTTILWVISIPIFTWLSIRYFNTGLISPYKALGLLSILGFSLGLLLLFLGVTLYSLSRQQLSIDDVLYYAKQRK